MAKEKETAAEQQVTGAAVPRVRWDKEGDPLGRLFQAKSAKKCRGGSRTAPTLLHFTTGQVFNCSAYASFIFPVPSDTSAVGR